MWMTEIIPMFLVMNRCTGSGWLFKMWRKSGGLVRMRGLWMNGCRLNFRISRCESSSGSVSGGCARDCG